VEEFDKLDDITIPFMPSKLVLKKLYMYNYLYIIYKLDDNLI